MKSADTAEKAGRVILAITMSLDGFVGGQNADDSNPLGTCGPRLHDCLFKENTPVDDEILAKLINSSAPLL